ncbi:hypothetical protein [Nostoc sp. MG11]|uniref:hypothetical protein n=1 Tax=Nostoc sp. MG11 TaxID=2721166 RepID=UPI001867EF55|nr:hypothetical protein [Nostoc sp. MG11]
MNQERLGKHNRVEALILQGERLLQELDRGFEFSLLRNHRQRIKSLIQELREHLAQDDDQGIDQAYKNLELELNQQLNTWDEEGDSWDSDDDITGGSAPIPNPRRPSPKPGTNDSAELPPRDY